MTLRIIHRGVVLDQQQLDAIVPVLNDSMNGVIRGKKKLEAAIDKALEAAGCPVTEPATDNAAQD